MKKVEQSPSKAVDAEVIKSVRDSLEWCIHHLKHPAFKYKELIGASGDTFYYGLADAENALALLSPKDGEVK